MKTRTLAAFAAAAALAVVAHAEGPLALGTSLADVKAASVEMKNVDGKNLSIASAKGPKGTLVVFTCDNCPYAKAWEERTVALGNEYAGTGVGVIAVNANDPAVAGDTAESMVKRSAERKMAYPYVVDATSDVARAFGATRTPEYFLFDASGKLVYHGAFDDNAQKPAEVKETYLKNALEATIAGKPVTTAETKAIGCGIKFRAKS